jgi:hypothetical protein
MNDLRNELMLSLMPLHHGSFKDLSKEFNTHAHSNTQ